MEFSPYANASLYDDVFESKRADCDYYVALARKHRSRRILERFCGTGRILLTLFQRLTQEDCLECKPEELHCCGLDLEPTMLEYLTGKVASLPRTDCYSVEAIVGDVTQFQPPDRQFDLIIDGGGSFHLLASQREQRDALLCACSLLSESGHYVLDLWNPNSEWLAQCSKREVLELSHIDNGADGSIVVRKIASAYSSSNQRLSRHIFVERYDKDGRQAGSWYQHETFRIIYPGELTLLLGAAGLNLIELKGSYASDTFDDHARRMIATCDRKQ